MKKLVTFGDSFIATITTSDTGIANLTAKNLNLQLSSHGHSGSALQYSILEFLKYVESDQYDKEDVVLFVLTGGSRVYVHDMPNPQWAYMSNVTETDIAFQRTRASAKDVDWLISTAPFLKWAQEKLYHRKINTEIIRTVALLRSFAETFDNKVIILNAFKIDDYLGNHIMQRICTQTVNFITLGFAGIPLFRSSFNEFASEALYHETTERIGYDPRMNHFSEVNRKIVADMLANVITHGNSECWNTNQLLTGIYDKPLANLNWGDI